MRLPEAEEKDVTQRLRRIEGQVRGLQRMVEEGRYCGDVLTQITSVQRALRAVGERITRNHLETCVTEALRSGDREAAQETYDEIMNLLYKQLR
ncbi:MAG: metal-sensitive transcriptional regulator [Rhodothermales bacterium]